MIFIHLASSDDQSLKKIRFVQILVLFFRNVFSGISFLMVLVDA